MELLLGSSRDPALLPVLGSERLAWGTGFERKKSSFSFPAGFQHLLTPGGTKILGEQLWLHPTAASGAWAHLFTSPQTSQSTIQLCYSCLGEQGEVFLPGAAQVCVPAVLGQLRLWLGRADPSSPCPRVRNVAVSSHELHKAAYKRAGKHSPATSKNSENVSTGMNSSWKVFRALSAASWIGMSLCRMNSAREKDQPPSVLLVGTFWQGMKTPNQAKNNY